MTQLKNEVDKIINMNFAKIFAPFLTDQMNMLLIKSLLMDKDEEWGDYIHGYILEKADIIAIYIAQLFNTRKYTIYELKQKVLYHIKKLSTEIVSIYITYKNNI